MCILQNKYNAQSKSTVKQRAHFSSQVTFNTYVPASALLTNTRTTCPDDSMYIEGFVQGVPGLNLTFKEPNLR